PGRDMGAGRGGHAGRRADQRVAAAVRGSNLTPRPPSEGRGRRRGGADSPPRFGEGPGEGFFVTNAEKALERVRDGMTLGLGTGSAAGRFVAALGERVRAGLRVRCVATSDVTAALA